MLKYKNVVIKKQINTLPNTGAWRNGRRYGLKVN